LSPVPSISSLLDLLESAPPTGFTSMANFVESSTTRLHLQSVVRALPSSSRSQSADRFTRSTNWIQGGPQSPEPSGTASTLDQRCGQSCLLPNLVACPWQHSTCCCPSLRLPSSHATAQRAVGPAARLPATQ